MKLEDLEDMEIKDWRFHSLKPQEDYLMDVLIGNEDDTEHYAVLKRYHSTGMSSIMM